MKAKRKTEKDNLVFANQQFVLEALVDFIRDKDAKIFILCGNALRAVLGYVLTCHKARGGEWKEVFLDIPIRIAREPKASTYQWLYATMTRVCDTLHIVDDFYVK